MNPMLGRLLDFDPKMGEQWEKADKILEEIHWDFSKLTAENIRFFKLEFDPIGRKRPLENEIDKLPTWALKFEILEVYPGNVYDDTALSQIYFDGIDVH